MKRTLISGTCFSQIYSRRTTENSQLGAVPHHLSLIGSSTLRFAALVSRLIPGNDFHYYLCTRLDTSPIQKVTTNNNRTTKTQTLYANKGKQKMMDTQKRMRMRKTLEYECEQNV